MTSLPFTAKWSLRSEPWVFLVDGAGNVAARFEAVVTINELTEALTPLLDAADTDSGSEFNY